MDITPNRPEHPETPGHAEQPEHRERQGDTVDLGDGWIEKDGEVTRESVDEILPQAEPTDGPAPLP